MRDKTTFIYGDGLDGKREIISKRGYVTEEMLNQSSLVVLSIGKTEVKRKDFDRINNLLNLLEKKGKESCGKINLVFDYDFDNREIYEINDVCEYMLLIFLKCPHIFYYLLPVFEVATPLIYCLAGVKVISKNNGITESEPINPDIFINCYYTIALKTLEYGGVIGDYERAIEILKSLGCDRYLKLDSILKTNGNGQSLRRSHQGIKGIRKDNYSDLPKVLEKFNYYYDDGETGHVIMAIPETILEEAERNGDLDLYECPFPCRYVLQKGYQMYKDHVICDGHYNDFGLDIDESYYEL